MKEYLKAIEAKWSKQVASLEQQLKNASTSQEANESSSAAAIAAKASQFEEERKIMQMKIEKLQADAQREHKMLEALTKDSKEQNRLLKKEIADLATKNEKLNAKVISVVVRMCSCVYSYSKPFSCFLMGDFRSQWRKAHKSTCTSSEKKLNGQKT